MLTAVKNIIDRGKRMIDNDFIERRSASRMNVVCPVTVYDSKKERSELIRNLSASGLKLETRKNLDVNETYDFEFTLPDGPNIKLEGEVCWRYPKRNNIYYGVRFKQLGFMHRIRLKYFLNRRIRSIKKKVMEEHYAQKS